MFNKEQYLVKYYMKKLHSKGLKELVCFYEAYKFNKYICGNNSGILFRSSNLYFRLSNLQLVISKVGIPEVFWYDFIAQLRKKDDFKRHVAYIAYKFEIQELKNIVNKLRGFDKLYNWIYANNFDILKDYINILINGQDYSVYYINPKFQKLVTKIYRRIKKNETVRYNYLRKKGLLPRFSEDEDIFKILERLYG